MKKVIFAIVSLLCCFSIGLRAQDTLSFPKLPIDTITKLVSYKEIVTVEGVKSTDLYSRGREWFAVNFKSANNVLQMDDKEAGKLIGKGTSSFNYLFHGGFGAAAAVNATVNFTVTITIKDFKYRAVVSDFFVTNSGVNSQAIGEAYLTSYDQYKHQKLKSYMKQAMQMQVDLLNDVDKLGRSTLSSIKSAMQKQVKDDF